MEHGDVSERSDFHDMTASIEQLFFKRQAGLELAVNSQSYTEATQSLLPIALQWLAVDANTFAHNAWLSGFFGSEDSAPEYTPGSDELRLTTFDANWFAAFPTALNHDPKDFAPTATAPWLDLGNLVGDVPTDHDGNARHDPVDLGPYER